ncbi:hypothetical protein ACWDZ4_20555 [Streptomyces sp. NPDC003016]
MPTPRTRKPAPDDTEITEAPEDKAVADDTDTKIPDVAPLEPPAEPAPEPVHEPLTTAQQLLPAQLGDRIVDDATGRPPTDPDTIFIPVMPYGSTMRCTVRLVEHVGLGTYRTPTTRLLVPVGAELKRAQAERIVAQLHAQTNTAHAGE